MKRGGKTAICLSAFCFAIAAKAVVNDGGNPYHPIVERNVFGLKDPPPPPEPKPEGPPPPKITLTGITDVLGRKLALLEWVEPVTPGQPANNKKNYSTLTEGQREGKVEVLEIDVKAGTVKVNNYGVTNTLSFKDDSAKPPAASFAAPPAGGIPPPTASIPAPASPQPYAFASTTTTIGTGAGAAPGATPGVKTIPSRQLRLPASVQAQTAAQGAQQPTQQLSKEEQEVLIEVERELHKDNPAYPPPPPTSLNPTANLAPPASPAAPATPK